MEKINLELKNSELRIKQGDNVLNWQVDEINGAFITCPKDTVLILSSDAGTYIETCLYMFFHTFLQNIFGQFVLFQNNEKLPFQVDIETKSLIWPSLENEDYLKITYANNKNIIIEARNKKEPLKGKMIHLFDKELYCYLQILELYNNIGIFISSLDDKLEDSKSLKRKKKGKKLF